VRAAATIGGGAPVGGRDVQTSYAPCYGLRLEALVLGSVPRTSFRVSSRRSRGAMITAGGSNGGYSVTGVAEFGSSTKSRGSSPDADGRRLGGSIS
jgi:hypothetical protein